MSRARFSPQSLVVRLVRAALLWAIPVLVIAAFLLIWLYRNSTYQILDTPLVETVTALVNGVEAIPQDQDDPIIVLAQEPVDPRYQRVLSGSYWQILSDGQASAMTSEISSRSLYGENIDLSEREFRALVEVPGAEVKTTASGPDGEVLRVVARSVIVPGAQRTLVMIAAVDQRSALRAVRRFGVSAVAILAVLMLGLIAAVLVQVRTGLRPLFDLRDRVVDVREGRAQQVQGEYPTEIDPLAVELNSLIAHNKDVVERARTHVANLAHALKTPLAVLQNEASSEDGALGKLTLRQTEIMTKQVNHHLSRARAAARAQTIGMRADVSATLHDLVRTMDKIHRQKNVDIDSDWPENLIFRGEKTDLEEMAGNLLDNAFKWARSAVRVKAEQVGAGRIKITVDDDGPGVDEADYGAALKRGERLDTATPGTGFGLSIVDDLARAYKGELRLGRSDLGGLCVMLHLPATQGKDPQV